MMQSDNRRVRSIYSLGSLPIALALGALLLCGDAVAKSYRSSPSFILSHAEYKNIKTDLKLSPSQEKGIGLLFDNKGRTQQQLIKSANRLIRIVNAYDSIKNPRITNLDHEAVQQATALSEAHIKEMRAKFQAINSLKEKAHLIDNLGLEEILDKGQMIRWYEHKFYTFIKARFSRENRAFDDTKMRSGVSKTVAKLLSGHKIINQQVIDLTFKELLKALQ